MKALIIYDSEFGNTEQIAQAIAKALGPSERVTTLRASSARPEQLAAPDLLIVGSPTQRFLPIPPVSNLLRSIPRGALQGVKVAAFDTRLPQSEIDRNRVLAFFVRIFGYAAGSIAKQLRKKGGDLVATPEGFIVSGIEGPLAAGELERAAAWAKQLAAAA